MSNRSIHRNRSRKRSSKTWYVLWPVWLIVAVMSSIYGYGVLRAYLDSRPQQSDVHVKTLERDEDLHLDGEALTASRLHLFETNLDGKRVRFVVQRTDSRAVHVALASCRNCYKSRESHYARNGSMICGECKHAMAFEDKGAIKDGCAMPEIPHTEEGEKVFVSSRDVIRIAEENFK